MEKTIPLRMIFLDTENGLLDSMSFMLTFSLLTDAESVTEEDLNRARKDQNIVFAKICNFAESLLDQSIVYAIKDSTLAYSVFAEFGNNLITLPTLNEMSLAAALHAKLNTICRSNTIVERIKLQNVNENIMYEYITDEDDYPELPDASEWGTEYAYFSGCWWERNDVNTMDRNADTEEEYNDWLKLREEQDIDANFSALFLEIERQFNSIFDAEETKDAELIEVDFKKATWKPKIVD